MIRRRKAKPAEPRPYRQSENMTPVPEPELSLPQPSAEIAPGVLVRYDPNHTEPNEAGEPDPMGVGHFHLVELATTLDPGEPLTLRFYVDDRDGPIPQIVALKIRRAGLDLDRTADFLNTLGSNSYRWKANAAPAKD